MNAPPSDATEAVPNERLADFEQLVWALLDEQITDEEFRRLEQLIVSDDQARATYLQCVQMHVDLSDYYAKNQSAQSDSQDDESQASGPQRSPVLGFLGQGMPTMPIMPPMTNP